MTVTTTSTLSNSLRAQYIEDYERGAQMVRLYDSLAMPVGMDMSQVTKGSSVVIPFISDMEVGTTAISETTDVTPSAPRDATVSITPTSRWGAMQVSEKMLNQAYTNYGAERFHILGKNQMETVDSLARTAAVVGVFKDSPAHVARASINASSTHYIGTTAFANAQANLETLKVPSFIDSGRSMWSCIMHPYVFADLRAATTIVAVGEYQKANIILAHELGELGPFKLQVSPFAHMFWAAGSVRDASSVATTVAASATANIALAKTVEVASATGISAGHWYTIGSVETGTTIYPTTERVFCTSISSTTVTIAGEGANGGLRFDHAVGETFKDADSVAAVVFGGPKSLAKVYDVNTGEFGEVVGPKKQGLLDQFESLGWKFYGNYARTVESRLLRYECAISIDAS